MASISRFDAPHEEEGKDPPPVQSEVNVCCLCNLHCTRCNRDTLARTRFETLWQIARASDEGESQADEIVPGQQVAEPFAGIARTRAGDTAWPRCKDWSIPWTGLMGHGRFDRWRGFHLRVGRARMASPQTTEVSGQRTRKLISLPDERSTDGLAGANHVGWLVSLVPVKAVTAETKRLAFLSCRTGRWGGRWERCLKLRLQQMADSEA